MSNTAKARKALVTAAKARLTLLGFPVSWPNKKFDPPNNAPWIGFHYVPAGKTAATLGEGGEDELVGFIQFDINVPQDSGEEVTENSLSALESYFVAGRSVIYDSQAVTISSNSRTSGRTVDPYWRTSLTVNFYARIIRSSLT